MIKNLLAAAAVAMAFNVQAAEAQSNVWPNGMVKVITPTSPGTSTDYFARHFSDYASKATGEAFIVENRPGANAIIGADAARKSPSDGQTLFVSSVSVHSANPALMPDLSYDPVTDFIDIGFFSVFPYYLLVSAKSDIHNLEQLKGLLKNKPDLTCGFGTVAARVPCEILRQRADIPVTTVPYKSVASVLQDLVGGYIDFTFADAMSASNSIQSGLVRAIAVTANEKVKIYPDVALLSDSIPDFTYEGWAALSVPAGTPADVVEKINILMNEATQQPDFVQRLEQAGAFGKQASVEETRQWIRNDQEKWKNWVSELNISLN